MGKGRSKEKEKERKKRKRLETFNNINSKLSIDVIQVIFSKFSIVNLPFFRLVCKSWNGLISDYYSSSFKLLLPNPIFVAFIRRENLTMYYIDFDAKEYDKGMELIARFELKDHYEGYSFVNSCNGFICLENKRAGKTASCGVLNPMTNEFKELPISIVISTHFCLFQLCFSLKMNQYKMIRFMITFTGDRVKATDICTLGCNEDWRWRSVDFTPFDNVPVSINLKFHCCYLNGVIYWVGGDMTVLWRFDVEAEKFEAISLPNVDSSYSKYVYIQVFNGHLYANLRRWNHPCDIDVWIMRSDGGEVSWRSCFVVKNIPSRICRADGQLLRLIKIYENGEILFFVPPRYLILYDSKNNKRIKKTIANETSDFFRSLHQIQSPNFDSLKKMETREQL